MSYEIKVGRNSLAVVETDFESKEDQLGLDIYVALNAAGIEGVEPDLEDEAEDLLEEAAEIFITALRNYAIEQGVELSDTDLTEVQ